MEKVTYLPTSVTFYSSLLSKISGGELSPCPFFCLGRLRAGFIWIVLLTLLFGFLGGMIDLRVLAHFLYFLLVLSSHCWKEIYQRVTNMSRCLNSKNLSFNCNLIVIIAMVKNTKGIRPLCFWDPGRGCKLSIQNHRFLWFPR